MAANLHRYGCRCPSCNEGTTRTSGINVQLALPIPPSTGTEIRTPADVGMPTKPKPTPAKRKRPSRAK